MSDLKALSFVVVSLLLFVVSTIFYNIYSLRDNRMDGNWTLETCSPIEIPALAPYNILECGCANYTRKQDWTLAPEVTPVLSKEDREKLDFFGSCDKVVDESRHEHKICTKKQVEDAYSHYLCLKYGTDCIPLK